MRRLERVTPTRAEQTEIALHDAFARSSPALGLRRLLTEFYGTFALVFVDCGGAVVAKLSPGEVTGEARSLATGLTVMALVYTMGNVSGAHINPSVTLAFAMRGVFPWRRVPLYWLAQLAGAVLAAAFLRVLFGDVDHLGATSPGAFASVGVAFAMEVALTTLLVSVILGTATRHRVVGANAALAAGGTVALCGLFARPVSGASMNAARSLGPAIASGWFSDAWIYAAGPMAGAVLATLLMRIIHAHRHREEKAAASGDKG